MKRTLFMTMLLTLALMVSGSAQAAVVGPRAVVDVRGPRVVAAAGVRERAERLS